MSSSMLVVPDSRFIALPITRIRATGRHPVEPIYHLDGGPVVSNMQAPSR